MSRARVHVSLGHPGDRLGKVQPAGDNGKRRSGESPAPNLSPEASVLADERAGHRTTIGFYYSRFL